MRAVILSLCLFVIACGESVRPCLDSTPQPPRDVGVDLVDDTVFPQVGDAVIVSGYNNGVILSKFCCPVLERKEDRFLLGGTCGFWIKEDNTFWVFSCITGREERR